MKKSFISLISFLCITCTMFGVNAYPGWLTMDQPDGTTIEVRQMGDEYYHYWANRDGQEVEQNDEGWWVVKSEQLTTAQRRARRAASPKMQTNATMDKSYPARGLVILVNFNDVKMQSKHDSAFYCRMLNTLDSVSVRQYFKESSDGNYVPEFDVWGPVDLDSAMAYYGANNSSGDDVRPGCMVSEACKKAYARGCDFSKYATKKSSQVDNVHIIYAGYSEAAGAGKNCIWPHKWNVYWANGGCRELYEDPSIVGKQIYCYSCSAELLGKSGTTSASIGTFCHEFSHVLGLTDYYDVNGTINGDNDMTPASWALMDCGNYNNNCKSPALYSIFDKIYMGWATMPTLLKKNEQKNVIMPVGTQYSYYITGGTEAKDYTCTDTIYYLENRQKSGYFDKGLLYSGMLIWRVIYKSGWSNVNSTAGIVRYTLASATGLETGIGTNKDPFPGYNNVKYKKLFDGCELSSITLSNKIINFKYNGGEDQQLTHTWMANGSQFAVTNSYSTLTFPGSSPSACNNRTFYGWTEQTEVEADGTGLVLTKNYSDVSINKTFYAVYRTTAQPYRYSFYCTDFTDVLTDDTAMIVSTQYYKWHGQVVTAEGQYYDTIRTIDGDSVLRLNVSYVHARRAITYVASEKLKEVQEAEESGLHIDVFGQPIQRHCFSSGSGTIVFENYLTTIGDNAFYGCSTMDSVVIPKSVTTIGDRAFSMCSNLKSMALKNSAVTSIGDAAFYKCQNMTAISLPPAITRIGDRALYYCKSLGSVSIPASVTTIDKYAFGKCYALTSLSLPESVTTIGDSAFYNCNKLTKIKSYNLTPPTCGTNSFIDVPNTIPVYVWASAEEDYENDAKWQYFFDIRPFDCGDPATRDTVRATVAAGSSYAFRDTVYTQSGIYMDTTMDKYGCDTNIYRLELVVLDSAKVIIYSAPQKLAETTDYSTPGNGLHTGSQSFGQAIAVHTFIDGVGYIAFRDTLRTIGESAFYGCREGYGGKMTAITVPKTVTSLGTKALSNCRQLQSLILPEGLTSIGNEAFRKCYALTTITMEKYDALPTCNVASSFKDDSIKDITLYVWPIIYNTYKADASWGKFNVQKLSCDHPAVVKETFVTMCEGETYDFRGQQCTEAGEYHDYVVNKYGCDTTDYFLHLTVGNKYLFQEAAVFETGHSYPWRDRVLTEPGFYFDSLHTIHGCDSVYAFYLADSTRAIVYTAPNKLIETTKNTTAGLHTNKFGQTMVAHTFNGTEGIIVFDDTVRIVGKYAFYGCQDANNTALTSIVLPQTITSIGDSAFYACFQLSSISIPESVTAIGQRAFHKCTGLSFIRCEALTLPSCGANCFYNVPAATPLYVWPIKYEAYHTTSPWSTFNVQKINCDHPYKMITTYDTICQGETYTWRGKQYTTTVTRRDTVTNKYGCDSVCYRLKLQVNPTYLLETSATIVESQTYEWRDSIYATSGIYYDSLKTKLGCDSVYKLTLSVIPANRVIIYTSDKKLTEINSPAQSTSIGFHTYNFGQPMVSHTFDEGTKIGYITFASPLTQIGDSAFYGCRDEYGKLSSITIPNTVTKFGNAAFYFCKQLTSLTIPENVTTIGNRGIFRCTGLQSIRCEALTPPTCGTECCSLTVSARLYVWPIALQSYQGHSYWGSFFNGKISKITCDQHEVDDLTRDTICQGDSLLWLGKYYKVSTTKDSLYMNKYGCDTVHYRLELTVGEKHLIEENVTWVNGMTYLWHGRNLTATGIYYDSLKTKLCGCDSVYKLTLNFTDSTRAIIYTAAKKLKEVSKLTELGLHTNAFGQTMVSHSFANNVGVIAFADPITQIGNRAFYGCNSNSEPLLSVIMPSTITSIGSCAFYANFSLTALDIPEGVTTIGDSAFHRCPFTSLVLPEHLTQLGVRALNRCESLKTLTSKALIPPTCGENCFNQVPNTTILYVWKSKLDIYPTASGWNYFTDVRPIECENIPDVDTTRATICPGEKYTWRKKDYTAKGTYSDTLRNIYGCDSAIHRLILSHYPTYEIQDTATFVTGLTYVWHGKNLTEAGTYYDSLSTIHGCDSVIALTLTMTDSTKAIIYTAPAKLSETPIVISGTRLGLRVNAFGQPIISHSFSNGTGVLAFENDLTQVGDTAFYGCRNTDGLRVNTLTLPNTVTSIGDYAFYNCRNLTSVNIPSGVTTIGQAAFVRCEELSSIALPEGITELRYHVLYQCYALTELTLPASLDSIGKEALASCTGLTSLRVEAIHPPKCGKDCFKGITNTIPVSVWPIGFTEYQNSTPWQYFTTFQKIACENPLSRDTTRAAICSGDSYEWLGKQYTVAGNYDSLTTNDYGCDTVMKRLELTVNPTYLFEERDTTVQGMTHIWRGHVIANAGGTKVYWDSLKTINGCDSVYKLTLAAISNVKAIMYKAPKKLTVTDDYNTVGVHSTAFDKTITDHYFRGRTGILIFSDKGSLTQVGNRAFYGCTSGSNNNEVDTIILPISVTTIGDDAFYNCQQLTSINIPNTVTSIGERAFYRCVAMKTFVLPEGITVLKTGVFDRCTALDTITIPSSVTQVDSVAFARCTNLKSVTSEALTPPVCHVKGFGDLDKSEITLNVYPICEQVYRKANVWKDFFIQKIACGTTATRETTIETICQGDSVEWRGKYYKEAIVKEDTTTKDIYGCDSTIYRLELTVHPSYLIQETAIFVKGMTYTWRERNFTMTGVYYDSLTTELGCDSVYKLTLTMTDSTKAIIYTANDKLKEVSYYNSGLHLGGHGQSVISHTFQNGVGVVAFANDLTQLGARAFYQCNNSNKNHLQTVILPKTITSIGQSAFFACTNMTSVTIPDGVKTFGDSVFNKCRKLTDINIPEGVTTMGVRMLNECVGLRDVTIPSTVTSLGVAALRHDSTWTSITCKALNPPTCGTSCFQKMYPERNKTLYVLPSVIAAYKKADGWKDFYNIQAIKCDTIKIDADASISDYAGQDLKDKEIIVSPGKTFTIDMTDTVSALTVETGATVAYEAGATLTMGALNIEGGYSADKTTFDMPRIYIPSGSSQIVTNTTINLDLRVDKSNYYPFSVPFPVAVSAIDYIDPVLNKASTYGTHYGIKTYDGDRRAKNGEGDANWRLVESTETLQPGVGYILTAVAPAKYDSRIRIPMTVDNGWTANGEQSSFGGNRRDQVTVTAYTGTEAEKQPRHGGWNFIANPYLSRYDGADISSDIEYVSIPTYNFSEYVQVAMEDTVLLPEWGFFVQAAANETMTFANAGRQEVSPRYAAQTEDERIKIPLLLSDQTKSDKTTLIVADRYTTAYEVGADLEKMFGNAYTLATYTLAQTTRLAFQAMPTAAAEQPIPVGYRAPAQGEYTFSLANTEFTGVERVDLIDYTTHAVTNLLNGTYTFESAKTQDDTRFAINVVLEKKVPTDIPTNGSNTEGARKFFYRDKLYIERNGHVYDATGKEVTL